MSSLFDVETPHAATDPWRGPRVEIENDAASSAAPDTRPEMLGAQDVIKSYRKGKHVIPVLKGVDLSVRKGEFVSIVD